MSIKYALQYHLEMQEYEAHASRRPGSGGRPPAAASIPADLVGSYVAQVIRSVDELSSKHAGEHGPWASLEDNPRIALRTGRHRTAKSLTSAQLECERPRVAAGPLG